MDKRQKYTRIISGIKILFWLGLLAFFAYSFQTIMDLEVIGNPHRQEAFIRVITALSRPDFSIDETNHQVIVKMWETLQIAFLATTMSAGFAIPFTFLTARPSSLWGRGANILFQPMLSAVRAIHPLIMTFAAIILFGIGPTSGVLALTLFSTAFFIVDYSEYAQQHISLSWPVLFKVHFPALTFKHFHVNILIATVLGFTGGGGIGSFLIQNINLVNYPDAGLAILACIITIGSLDLLGRAVWHIIQNKRESLPSNT